MKKLALIFVLLLLAPAAFAQSSVPTCGHKNDSAIDAPTDYTTLTPPAEGASYTDSTFGCTVTRVTNGPVDYGSNTAGCHPYVMTPVNTNDTMIATVSQGCSSIEIRSFPDGKILIPSADPSLNGLNANSAINVWEPGNSNKFLFVGGVSSQGTATQLMVYNVYRTTGVGTVGVGTAITLASATGLANGASITIQGAGASGALYSGTVSSFSGANVTISPATSTSVSAPIVAIGYDTVQHDFSGTFTHLYAGSHGTIASSTCCIALMGELANTSWEEFSYDYTTDTVHTPALLHWVNPTGVTVSATTASGLTGIVLAKSTGTGTTNCGTTQHGACQFTVAGDSTIYTMQQYSTTGSGTSGSTALTVANASGLANGIQIVVTGGGASGADLTTTVVSFSGTSVTLATALGTTVTNTTVTIGVVGYGNGNWDSIAAAGTAAFCFAPALAATETAGAAVTLLFKSNDPRIVGNGYITTETSDNLSYDLYNSSMVYQRTPNTQWGGNTPHNDQNIDPANGHPAIYASASNDIGTDACTGNGVEKIDMITDTRTCLMTLSWFGDTQHYSSTNNGLWLFLHETDGRANKTGCLPADLPSNWSSLWLYPQNEVDIINVDTGDIYRLAHHYSRVMASGCGSSGSYWANPRVAVSGDGAWGIFDSNFGQASIINANVNYTDVYAVSTGIGAFSIAPNIKSVIWGLNFDGGKNEKTRVIRTPREAVTR